MEKDHDLKIKSVDLIPVSAINNEEGGGGGEDGKGTLKIKAIDLDSLKGMSGVDDEKDTEIRIPKLVELLPVQAIENEKDTEMRIPKSIELSSAQPIDNEDFEIMNIPLDGRWILAQNPTLIGTNFRTLTNMRYAQGHPESIMGMTKINTSVMNATYLKARNAYHLTKQVHVESHLMVQAFNATLDRNQILQITSTTTIPNQGNFESHVLFPKTSYTNSSNVGNFCSSPNGQVIYCDKTNVCIWDGDESRIPAFLVIGNTLTDTSSTITNCNDVTEFINIYNNSEDNFVYLGSSTALSGGTFFYCNFDFPTGQTTDGKPSGNVLTATTGQVVSFPAGGEEELTNDTYKFGGACLYVTNTTNDIGYVTIPYEASMNYGTGGMTAEAFIRWNAGEGEHATTEGLFSHYKDANNYWFLQAGRPSSNDYVFRFYAITSGVCVADYNWTIADDHQELVDCDFFQHVAVVRDGADVRLYVQGYQMTSQTFGSECVIVETVTQAIGAGDSLPTYSTEAFYIGCQCGSGGYGTYEGLCFIGWMDEARVSNIARYNANFTPANNSYTSSGKYFLVGSTRPAQGLKMYINTGNTTTSTLSAKYYTGDTWTSLTISDGTSSGGKTLAQTGKITWTEPVDSAGKTKEAKHYLEGYHLYWYLFEISAGSAVAYHATLDMDFEIIRDLWDGNFKEVGAVFMTNLEEADGSEDNSIADKTLNVLNVDDYIDADETSFMYVAKEGSGDDGWDFTTSDWIAVGFTERCTALYIDIPQQYGNKLDVNSVMTVQYWNGSEWTSVGKIADGTSVTTTAPAITRTLGKTGVVVWHNSSEKSEKKKSICGSFSLYYYRIMVSAEIENSKDVRINYIAGIPCSQDIKGYSFGVHAADRLMIGCDNYEQKNKLWISAQDRPEVFNGSDSHEIVFGGNEELTCGIPVYATYASNVYNIVFIFKAIETWILKWEQTNEETVWARYCIAANIGCPAPRTLCVASVTFGNSVNNVKAIAIWRSHDGIYISNGQSPYCVSRDIESVFDPMSSTKVNTAMIAKEFSFVDELRNEYHWLWASGSNTTLDKEYVLDMNEWKWFEVDRGSGLDLQCGVTTIDTYGNKYNYGFIDTGYAERLEYGVKFDGTNITSTMRFGELLPAQTISLYTSIYMSNLICVPKATDSSVTMTHYLDGNTAGSDSTYTFTISNSTHEYANSIKDIASKPAIFHGIQLSHVSTSETKGFEPLYFTIYWNKVRRRLL